VASLERAVAVVTGGTRGIGFAIVEALLDRGVSVVAGGRSPDSCEQARARLATSAERAARLAVVAADLTDAAQAEALVRTAVERFGGLDILVNNAGVGVFREVASLSVEEWRRVLDTNLSAVFYCSRAAIPYLRRRGGWIINMSSLAARNTVAGGAAYCASKAGLNLFSEVLMQEVRYDGIRVSVVMPGSVDTEFMGREAGAASDWKLRPADVARVVVDLLEHDPRSLPSRVEIRPAQPRR
jgi:3-oxoacyl-[acyl-carrier protein] reductase